MSANAGKDELTCVILPFVYDYECSNQEMLVPTVMAQIDEMVKSSIAFIGKVRLVNNPDVELGRQKFQSRVGRDGWLPLPEVIETGKNLNADFVVHGKVDSDPEEYAVGFYLVDMKHEKILSGRFVHIDKPFNKVSKRNLAEAIKALFTDPFDLYDPFFKPNIKAATLDWSGGEIVPSTVRNLPPMIKEYLSTEHRITVFSNRVAGISVNSSALDWVFDFPAKKTCEVLAHGSGVLYLNFGEMQQSKYMDAKRFVPDRPLKIQRISEKDGELMLPLDVDFFHDGSNKLQRILDVLPASTGVVVLTATESVDSNTEDQNFLSYRVCLLNGGTGSTQWERRYGSECGSLSSGHYDPWEDDRIVVRVQAVDGSIVVCAGQTESVRCFQLENGKEVWTLSQELLRQFFNKGVHCRIVGGPVVAGVGSNRRYYLAVSASGSRISRYAKRCLLLEITEQGVPLTFVNLPKEIVGSQYSVLEDGIIWRCEDDGLARIGRSSLSKLFEPVSDGNMLWYREFYPQIIDDHFGKKPDYSIWLQADPEPYKQMWFDSNVALIQSEGGYIEEASDRTYHFPMDVFDLVDWSKTKVTLSVPFEGAVPLPQRPSILNGRYMVNPNYYLGIDGFQMKGRNLLITLTDRNGKRYEITFTLPAKREAQNLGIPPVK